MMKEKIITRKTSKNKFAKEMLICLTIISLLVASGCSSKYSQLTSNANTKKNSIVKSNPVQPKIETKVNANTNTESKVEEATSLNNTIQNDQSVPILMYHSVGNKSGNELIIPPALLKKQFQWLKDNGYTTITLDDLYNYFKNNKPIPKKSVVLTFDDGYVDNYTNMYPIIKEFGFNATVFIITNTVDKDPKYLTSAELKEMNANGIDIESHTVDHDILGEISYEKQLETLKDSKAFLENLLNKKVNYIAYPEGSYNSSTPKAAEDAGYSMGVSTDGRWSSKKDGMYKLERVYISAFFNMDTFEERVTNPQYKFK
ncbi:polysaccharide deacetylase family protein [Clostridium sp.]|uniref:polysaccharide deacetylase family protein n=1 Tax=Clostridium sp. TaxID=1506 RepID=UPI003D6CAF96